MQLYSPDGATYILWVDQRLRLFATDSIGGSATVWGGPRILIDLILGADDTSYCILAYSDHGMSYATLCILAKRCNIGIYGVLYVRVLAYYRNRFEMREVARVDISIDISALVPNAHPSRGVELGA